MYHGIGLLPYFIQAAGAENSKNVPFDIEGTQGLDEFLIFQNNLCSIQLDIYSVLHKISKIFMVRWLR